MGRGNGNVGKLKAAFNKKRDRFPIPPCNTSLQ